MSRTHHRLGSRGTRLLRPKLLISFLLTIITAGALPAASVLENAEIQQRRPLPSFSASSVSFPPPGQEVRVALLYADGFDLSVPAAFMIQRLLNNSNRSILPDHELIVDAFPFRSNSGDAPVELMNILGEDTPQYHAVAGPFTAKDTLDVVKLTARARMLHIHAGDSPGLSNRDKYPYSFRVSRSFRGVQHTMFHICALNDWRSVMSIWQVQDRWDTAGLIAAKMNITSYQMLSEDDAEAWVIEAWQENAELLIRSTRTRVIMVQISLTAGHELICRLHHARLSGLQYFVDSNWPAAWFLAHSMGRCTADEMYLASRAQVITYHATCNSGIETGIPTPHGDESHIPMTCMPWLTPSQLMLGNEFQTFAERAGMAPSEATWPKFFELAVFVHDAVCASLLAVHKAMYEMGVSAGSIERREVTAFQALAQSMSAVKLHGPNGHLAFSNRTGDPAHMFVIIRQDAIPGRQNGSLSVSAVATFPHGPDADPEISMIEENNLPFIWYDGSVGLLSRPWLALFPDCAQANSVLVWDSCEPCPPGTMYDTLLRSCSICSQGHYQDKSGMSRCKIALPGWYVVDRELPAALARCPGGHECPQAGQIVPHPCAKGRYAALAGQDACKLCPEGQYQHRSGATSCESCAAVLAGGVTAAMASTSPEECICPEGTFRASGADDHCSICLEGMTCPAGSDMRNASSYPLVQPGYMTLASDPLRVYRCAADEHCPGGPPASCAARRDAASVACGECKSGTYESGEACNECSSTDTLPLISTCVLGMVLVNGITLGINTDMHKTPAASMMIVATTSLLITCLQTMGLFSAMDVPWQEPVKTIFRITRFLSFDLELLKVSCVFGGSPILSFALRQLLAVLVIPCILVSLLAKKYAPLWGQAKTDIKVELCNSIGTFYSVFFISMVISALSPFICYDHPGGSGESVTSAPSLLCFGGGDHTAMIVIGMFALFMVPLPFLCLCLLGVVLYPRTVKSRSSSRFLHATRFLFVRYVPKRFFFQTLVLLRSLVVCMIPAILIAQPATQVLFICVVLCAYFITLELLRPWRAQDCNVLDAAMTLSLVILLLCGALFLEDTPRKEAISALSAGFVACCSFSAILAILYSCWCRLAPNYFHFFICHHKQHAAAQARYLKILLIKRRAIQVFIDSDNLQELDTLFEIVRSRVRHLIAFLTADTLQRPWCVGEIVSALRAEIPVTRLLSPSFAAPTDEQLGCPEWYVDTTGCTLSEYGIQWSDVRDAFSVLLSAATMQLLLVESVPGSCRFEYAAACLVKQRVRDQRVPMPYEIPPGGVLIITDPASDEATAAGGILMERIGPDIYRICRKGLCLSCDYEQDISQMLEAVRHAGVVIAVLSGGCLQSAIHTSVLCELARVGDAPSATPVAISVNIPGFDFPSAGAIDVVCRDPRLASGGSNDFVNLSAFFRRISIFLPTHAAQCALDTQSDEVFRRVQRAVSGLKRGLTRTLSTHTLGRSNSSLGVVDELRMAAASPRDHHHHLHRQWSRHSVMLPPSPPPGLSPLAEEVDRCSTLESHPPQHDDVVLQEREEVSPDDYMPFYERYTWVMML